MRTPVRVIFSIRVYAKIYQRDVFAVERCVIVCIDADSLGADGIFYGWKQRSGVGIFSIDAFFARTKAAAVALAASFFRTK